MGFAAQAEASRQQASREVLAEFTSVLNRFEAAPAKEKPAVARRLTVIAEQLSQQAKSEELASASRRVLALTSFEAEAQARDRELQERLRAEVRGLAHEAESMEAAALGRAEWLRTINYTLLAGAGILCGILLLRGRRTNSAV